MAFTAPNARTAPLSWAAGGAGLGLAIVRCTVEAHGGMVGVNSTLGDGATFTLRLPRG